MFKARHPMPISCSVQSSSLYKLMLPSLREGWFFATGKAELIQITYWSQLIRITYWSQSSHPDEACGRMPAGKSHQHKKVP
jgi:hypothetical protein